MTGTFSIKRRKAEHTAHRGPGQSSQASVLSMLGIFSHHTSPHGGSKATYIHLTDPTPDLARAAAQEWSLATGRPLPPHLRARSPLASAAPLDVRARAGNYAGLRFRGPKGIVTSKKLAVLPAEDMLNDARTAPQRRRLLHKAGAHGEIPAGFTPAARLAARPTAPRTPAQRARFRRNAAQQARHAERMRRG